MSSGLMIHVEVCCDDILLQQQSGGGVTGSPKAEVFRSAFQAQMQIDCYQERPDESGSLGTVHYVLEAMEGAENLLCTTFNGFKVGN